MKKTIAIFLFLIIGLVFYVSGFSLLDTIGNGQHLGIKTAYVLFLMAVIVEIMARFGLSNSQFTSTRDIIAFVLGVFTASIVMSWGQYQTQNTNGSLFPYWILAVCGLLIVGYSFSSKRGRSNFFNTPSRDKLEEE